MNFAERVVELRTSLNLSKSEFAAQCGMSLSMLHGFETGKHQPSIRNLTKLAEVFRVTCDYLLGLEHKTKPAAQAVRADTPDVSKRFELVIPVVISVTSREQVASIKPQKEITAKYWEPEQKVQPSPKTKGKPGRPARPVEPAPVVAKRRGRPPKAEQNPLLN